MSAHPKRYLAYLLRLWQADQNGNPVWRASLEDPRTGERRGFASLQSLIDFLNEQIIKEDGKNYSVDQISEKPDSLRNLSGFLFPQLNVHKKSMTFVR